MSRKRKKPAAPAGPRLDVSRLASEIIEQSQRNLLKEKAARLKGLLERRRATGRYDSAADRHEAERLCYALGFEFPSDE